MLHLMRRFTISAEVAIVGLSPDERSVVFRIIEQANRHISSPDMKKELSENGTEVMTQGVFGAPPLSIDNDLLLGLKNEI